MKYIFVIERKDNHGEFQSYGGGYYTSRELANDALMSIQSMTKGLFRISRYQRVEVRV
jgi:hypothetical protein